MRGWFHSSRPAATRAWAPTCGHLFRFAHPHGLGCSPTYRALAPGLASSAKSSPARIAAAASIVVSSSSPASAATLARLAPSPRGDGHAPLPAPPPIVAEGDPTRPRRRRSEQLRRLAICSRPPARSLTRAARGAALAPATGCAGRLVTRRSELVIDLTVRVERQHPLDGGGELPRDVQSRAVRGRASRRPADRLSCRSTSGSRRRGVLSSRDRRGAGRSRRHRRHLSARAQAPVRTQLGREREGVRAVRPRTGGARLAAVMGSDQRDRGAQVLDRAMAHHHGERLLRRETRDMVLVSCWFSSFAASVGAGHAYLYCWFDRTVGRWIDSSTENPQPFVWTKTADQILDSIKRYCERINQAGR